MFVKDFVKAGLKKCEGAHNGLMSYVPEFDQRLKRLEEKVKATKSIKVSKSPPQDLTLTKHQKIVPNFQQQEIAFNINQKLIEIEKEEPGYLEDLDDILKQKLKRLQEASGKAANNQGQKRGVHDDQDSPRSRPMSGTDTNPQNGDGKKNDKTA